MYTLKFRNRNCTAYFEENRRYQKGEIITVVCIYYGSNDITKECENVELNNQKSSVWIKCGVFQNCGDWYNMIKSEEESVHDKNIHDIFR